MNTIRKVIIVVPVLITNCHVSENLKMGPVIAQIMIISKAIINAAGLPEAFVIFVAIRSKNKAKPFDFFFLLFMLMIYVNKKRKTQANNFMSKVFEDREPDSE